MIDAAKIADFLNTMMEADPTATHALIINRMPCNRAMADHPHVIVDQLGHEDRTVVGMLGVLNGLLAAVGSKKVVGFAFSDEPSPGTNRNALKAFVVVKVDDFENQTEAN